MYAAGQYGDCEQREIWLCIVTEWGKRAKRKMKAQQKEGVKRVMYGHLYALMTFPSTYKGLMEDALSHLEWQERGEAKKATGKPQEGG